MVGALYARKKLLFIPMMLLTGILVISELLLFFKAFSAGFSFGAVFSALMIILVTIFLCYATFCNFMMFKYFPEALDYISDDFGNNTSMSMEIN